MTEPRDIPLEDDEFVPEQAAPRSSSSVAVASHPDIEHRTMSPIDLVKRREKVEEIMATVMQEDVHYGIPKNKQGQPIFKKPMLYKEGIEVLCSQFLFRPHYEEMGSVHRENLIAYRVRCVLVYWPEGIEVSEGVASCNSWEKGKREKIASMQRYDQGVNVWEIDNSVLKQAAIRAVRMAVLTGTAASEVFARDDEKTRDSLRKALFAKADEYDKLHKREDSMTWSDWTKKKAQEEFGVESRSELDDEQWARLSRLLDEEAIPF